MFHGRPASISPAELDTEFPIPEDFPTDENAVVQKDCRQTQRRSGPQAADPVRSSFDLAVYCCKRHPMAAARGG